MTDSPGMRSRKVAPHRLATTLAAVTAILAIAALFGLTLAIGLDFEIANGVAVFALSLVVVSAVATVTVQNRSARSVGELESERRSLREAGAAPPASAKFIADASHDLRQPLHALGLFLDALERRVTPGEGEAILAKTREAAAATARLFEAVIDLARIEVDALTRQTDLFDIDSLLTSIPRSCADIASVARADVRVVHSTARVAGDERMVGHLLHTLLSNLVELGPSRILLGPRRRDGRLWLEGHCSRPGRPSTKWAVLSVPSSKTFATGRHAMELDLVVVRRIADLLGLELRVTATDRGVVLGLSLS